MITVQQVEDALKYLHESAPVYGQICGTVEMCHHMIKQQKGIAFRDAAGTVGERQAIADTSELVYDAVQALADAVTEKMTIQTRRKAMELKIEVWRSQNASNRTKTL